MIDYAKGSPAEIPGYNRGPGQLPLQWRVDTTHDELPASGLFIPGKGDPRAVPHTLIAMLYGATYDVDLSISFGSVAASYNVTMVKGEIATITEGEKEVLAGSIPITSISEITEFVVRPAIDPEDILIKPYSTQLTVSTSTSGTVDQLIIGWPTFTSPITYFAMIDQWGLGSYAGESWVPNSAWAFNMIVSDGEDGGGAGISAPSGGAIDDTITVCGSPVKLRVIAAEGSGGGIIDGSITVATWLPMTI